MARAKADCDDIASTARWSADCAMVPALQKDCSSLNKNIVQPHATNLFVEARCMDIARQRAAWLKAEMERLDLSPGALAKRAQPLADADGFEVKLQQQHIFNFIKNGKKVPAWLRYVERALANAEGADHLEDDDRHFDPASDAVMIAQLPTYAGMGGGGTGEGEMRMVAFSRRLIEALGFLPDDMILVDVEGDSMEPEYKSGDQLLVNKRKRSLAQPGAFCIWDGDGYVVKYLQKVHGSEPPSIRVISGNSRYQPDVRTAEEVQIMGRVEWFGRRV